MKVQKISVIFICGLIAITSYQNVDAQQNLAQEAYAIFEANCLNCHGEHGAFREVIIIEHTALIESGTVIPENPEESELYQRLIVEDTNKQVIPDAADRDRTGGNTDNQPLEEDTDQEDTDQRIRMPFEQPALSPEAIDTIWQWIAAGAPNWADTSEAGRVFITPQQMLDTIAEHLTSLLPADRVFARYFTMTHLYNAGETPEETRHAYQQGLSKLVNSLSWGPEVIDPHPIDPEKTIFYIDLRDYEWEIGTNRWTFIEAQYPYSVEFDAPTQTSLRETLTTLRQEMDCEVPFIHTDWFLATASLPPLYHDLLGLPETDGELETWLGVDVAENLRTAAGKRVWRAGFDDSAVSNQNRVVERHSSRYGAYWKSYDFVGNTGKRNIFTHPLSFTHDGSEIIFNLPNGLQAYYLADADGNRLDAAPTDLVSHPEASDPTVRTGLSCIGCHTEGMQPFADQVRAVIQKNANPASRGAVKQNVDSPVDNNAQALRLYVARSVMDALLAEDIERYRQALETIGDVFGGIEPIQQSHDAFQEPVRAAYAAAAVGLQTEVFLQKIRDTASLQDLGLLALEDGTMKRETWTSKFSEIVLALDTSKASSTPRVTREPKRPLRAPSIATHPDELDPATVQAWIERAQIEDDGSIAFRQHIAHLQHLLASLIPEKTALLTNYPNPFNPETWIPYQLAEATEVTLTIYAVNGAVVRTLELGHQPAGIYHSRSRAAFWDGRNDVGVPVASGIYFYTLTAGDFTATRKMLIKK